MKHLIAVVLVLVFSVTVPAQISPADAAKIRTLIAEKAALEKEKAELTRQLTFWKDGAKNWESLFLAEKHRADNVQAERIEELRKATVELKISTAVLRQQVLSDRQYIERLEGRVKSLKRQRLYTGIIGFATGTAFGSRLNF